MIRAIRIAVVVALCTFGITASASATTTHYWKGDGNALDSAGSANGSFVGTGVTFAAGRFGQAFSFDGTNSYVDFGNSAGNFGTGDATVSFWVNTPDNFDVMGLLGKRDGCGNGTMWDLRADPLNDLPSSLIAEFDGAGGYNTLRLRDPIADGTWHHLTFLRQGGTISIYRDGVLGATNTMGLTDMVNTADLLLGWSPCTNADQTRPFQGLLDDIHLSDTATPPYSFAGFFAPVDNNTTNVVQAGRAVPVKFSLGGDRGLDIFDSGSPSSHTVSCDSGDPLDDVEQTVTAGSSSLSYDPITQQYTYVWKTDKAWAGTCRELTLHLNDWSDAHTATFKFKK